MNVIVIVTDSLRQDFAYDAKLMPYLNQFIDRYCTRFTRAYTTAPWTFASHHSILNAVLPSKLDVADLTRNAVSDLFSVHRDFFLPKKLGVGPLDILKERGYYLFSMGGGGFYGRSFGFGGFDYFEEYGWVYLDVPMFFDRLENVGMDGYRNGKPWLFYSQDFDCHEPYGPWFRENRIRTLMEEVRGHLGFCMTSGLSPLPAEEVARVIHYYREACVQYDLKLMRIFDYLLDKGYLKDTMVVFLSDHGEELWDHGWGGHAFSLYEPVVKIPMAVHVPGVLPSVCPWIVSSVDIMPMILQVDEFGDGLNMLAGKRTSALAEVKFKKLFPETKESPLSSVFEWREKRAEISINRKVIRTQNSEGNWSSEEFDLEKDPGELYPGG